VRRLRRTVATEVVLGVAVLGVTGVLIAQPPGKAALDALHSKAKVATVAITSTAKAVVEINPGKHGLVQVAVQLTGSITPTEVTATASLPSKDLGPLPVPLQLAGPKSYTASSVLLPSSGSWQITVTVQTSQFDSTTAVAYLTLS
jgi:copper transport protein